MRKRRRIKPKYERYSNYLFIIITAIIFTLLFFFTKKQEFYINTADFKSEEKGMSAIVKESSDNFQPGDDKKPMPGKLKWGKDFDFAKDK